MLSSRVFLWLEKGVMYTLAGLEEDAEDGEARLHVGLAPPVQ